MTAEVAERGSVVLVVCQGHRCRALLGDGMDTLRAASAGSHRGVLVSTGCAGPCSHGPVVTLGSGRHDDGTLQVTTGAVLGPVGAEQVAALGDLVQQPSPTRLPAVLDAVRLWPARR